MRVLFCGRSEAHFPYHVAIIEALLKDGHTVKLLYDEGWSQKALFDNSSLTRFARRQPNLSVGWSRRRLGPLRQHYFPATRVALGRLLSQSAFAIALLPHPLDQLPPEVVATRRAEPSWATFAQERIGQRLFGKDRILNSS